MGLSKKQKRFVEEFLIDFNGRQAAVRAGYSANSAAQQAARMLTKDNIKAEIDKGREKISQKVEITQEMVINGLYEEAIRDGEGSSHAARVSAWEKLGKHLGIFTDKTEISGPGGNPVEAKWTVEFVNASPESK